MIEKKKLIILVSIFAAILIILIVLIFADLNLGLFKTLSISSINEKKQTLSYTKNKYNLEELKQKSQTSIKLDSQISFTRAKNEYDSISKETITIVKDATKEQKYLIEYLWVELGDYAENNKLRLMVLEPNTKTSLTINTTATEVKITGASANNKDKTTDTNNVKEEKTDTAISNKIIVNTDSSTIKVIVVGTYQDIADFVFEVENDKDLRFKLDNISMTYAGNNFVTTTFDVLDMSVLKK